jgi:hypothetical protein
MMRGRPDVPSLFLLAVVLVIPRGALGGQDPAALRAEATRTEAALRTEVRRAPPEAAAAARTLDAGRGAALAGIAGEVACGNAASAERNWAAYVRAERPSRDQVLGLLHFVLREAVREAADDVRFHLEKLEALNAASAALSEQMAELAEASRALERGRTVRVAEPVTAEDAARLARYVREHRADACRPASEAPPVPSLRPGRLELRGVDETARRLRELEERLDELGDDAQLAQVDLQNALARAQALLQMMSEISKALHDTAMAVIRNMGGA